MGIYLNPGNEKFAETVKKKIYVDKTMMISDINRIMEEENKYICMSRPRRFGKTISGNMLAAYYSKGCDSSELFSRFKIASDSSFRDKLNKYNVIQIDMNSEYQSVIDKSKLIEEITYAVNCELIKEFPEIDLDENESLSRSILKVYASTKEKFVIILDEYDVLVREMVSGKLFEKYLSFLNSLFKSNTLSPAIALAFITGILPIVRDKVQSKLNNFNEYTALDAYELARYLGFTDEEVKEICESNDLNYKECKLWYDGYHQHGYDIYNPEAIVKAATNRGFENYWGKTSSYEVISEKLRQNYEGLKEDVIKMLAGESVELDAGMFLNTLDKFINKDDVLTYLIHLGYLAYDREKRTCRIPNREVRDEWYRAITASENYSKTDEIIKSSKKLLEETISGNEEAVARALDESHMHVTSNRSYNNEDALQSAIYLAYIYALNEYSIFRELTAGKGFADVVFIPYVPDKPALIIELKKNKCVESAIEQIKDKKYFSELEHYFGNLLFVGINYDEKLKKHSCKIESFIKA